MFVDAARLTRLHPPLAAVFAACVLLCSPEALSSSDEQSVGELPARADIILDNDDPGTSSSGAWVLLRSEMAYNGSYRYGRPGQVNVYRFAPGIPQSGLYRIYGKWVAASNRSSRAAFDILHNNGTSIVLVNQQLNGNQWHELGVFPLEKGNAVVVEISDRNGIYAVADAVRFEYVGELPPPPRNVAGTGLTGRMPGRNVLLLE